jgi:hypothetical protein
MSANPEKPMIALTVNLDDILKEALSMLKTVHSEIESIAGAVNIHVNESLDSVTLFVY